MKIPQSLIVLVSLLSFVIGILIASFVDFCANYSFWFFSFSLVFFFSAIIFRKHKQILIVSCVFLFFFLAFFRYSLALPVYSPAYIYFFNDKNNLEIQGIVSKEVVGVDNKQKIFLKTEKIFLEQEQKVKGKILIYTDLYPVYQYGDVLKINCNLKKVENFADFDYQRYLAKDGIYSLCYQPLIEKVDYRGNFFWKNIFVFKKKIIEKIEFGLEEPASGILKAMLFDDKSSFFQDVQDLFKKLGISHIIAISGSHIVIICAISFMILLELGLWRNQAFVVNSIFLFFYLVIIAFPASAVRSVLMWFVLFYALAVGRLTRFLNVICLSAFILLLINPFLLRDDVGFQLSFLAVLGIVYIFPFFKKYYIYPQSKWASLVQDVFFVSVSAQIATAPISILNFKTFSIISPFVNVFVVWTFPFIMLFSFFAISLSFVFPQLTIYFFYPIELMIDYIIKVSEFFL